MIRLSQTGILNLNSQLQQQMNCKKDMKRQKPQNPQTCMSPPPKKNNNEQEYNINNLRDLSPYQAMYPTINIPNNMSFSNTQLSIIETPANTYNKTSYLEPIQEGYIDPIVGVINFDPNNQQQSQSYESDSQIIELSQFESKAQNNAPAHENPNKQGDQLILNINKTAEIKNNRPSIKAVQTHNHMKSQKKVFCNCKKTKCLKLYCDCFRVNQTCDGCNCVGCHNLDIYQQQRNNAMLSLIDRNPQAFKPKIQEEEHAKGCHCRKSNCLKKYCECFQAGLKCGTNCKCQQCKNKCYQDHSDDQPSQKPNQMQIKKNSSAQIKKWQNKQENQLEINGTIKKQKKMGQWESTV